MGGAWKRGIGCGVVVLAACALGVPAGSAAKARISPISAVFVPSKLATSYSVHVLSASAAKHAKYKWTLKLTLVDPAGATSPDEPGAAAAVDPTCDNAVLPHGKRVAKNTYAWSTAGSTFIWYHGDQGAYPGSSYGCDHTKMGPSGHEGLVTVTVTGRGFSCTASIKGTNLNPFPEKGPAPHCRSLAVSTAGTPAATTVATPTTTAAQTTTAATTSSSGGGFPIWIPIAIVLALLAAAVAFLVLRRGGSGDDCAELRARCRELRAAADAAASRAAEADAAARAAQAKLAQATAARQSAEQAAAAADHPDEGSFVENADTGERVTEHDLALLRAAGAEQQGADPAVRQQLRAQEQQRAHAALDAARSAETGAAQAAEQAAAAAAAAKQAAADAEAQADAACKAADECERAAAAAAQAAAAKAAQDAADAKSAQLAEEAKQEQAQLDANVARSLAADHAASAAAEAKREQRKQAQADELDRLTRCPEPGAEREVSQTRQFQLYLTWAGSLSQGRDMLLMDPEDVEEALEGFEKFETITSLAEFAEGFVTEDGMSATNADGILNIITTGTDQIFGAADQPNLVDPTSAAQTGVLQALHKLIDIVQKRRDEYGEWELSCPLVHVDATCRRLYRCVDGHWQLVEHQFIVSYGKKIEDSRPYSVSRTEQPLATTIRALYQHFADHNKPTLLELADFAKACGKPRPVP